MPDTTDLLRHTVALASHYLDGVGERPVGRPIAAAGLRDALGDGPLPAAGEDAAVVIDALANGADAGLIASAGPRYFGFVIGGSLPAALAADWLTSTWDQNAFSYVSSPAASVVEEIAGRWVREVLGLPPEASVGFTTGATASNMVGLAAARNAVLARAGWDVEANGLIGAPAIRILVGDEIHASALRALRFVGLGSDVAERIPVDDQGAIRADAAIAALAGASGPTIVLTQAGNVNSGAVDPFEPIVDAAHAVGAWVHVDGAFGLWAAASPEKRSLLTGVDGADSWAMDCHKWLNVPYDCGFVAVADRAAHYGAGRMTAAYLVPAPDDELDPFQWVPEASRRGRATPVYAALRSLGRDGVANLVDRCCELARRMAERLAAEEGIEILNDVVLNQVVARFGDNDDRTRVVIAAVQEDGTCWAGGTTWHGVAAMRLSVSSWATTSADIDRSADAIIRCSRANR
jgi:glutamate/tyrosine decarboxylase-like PLP-dependent enzyme